MQPLPRHAQPSEVKLWNLICPVVFKELQKVRKHEPPSPAPGVGKPHTYFPKSYHYLPRIQHSKEGKQVFKRLRGKNSWGRRGERRRKDLSGRTRSSKKLERITVLRDLQTWWFVSLQRWQIGDGLEFAEGKVFSSAKGMSHGMRGKLTVSLMKATYFYFLFIACGITQLIWGHL